MSLTKGTLYLTLSSFVFALSGYVVNVFLGRYLGPVSYGNYGIIISLVTVVNLIQTTGLPKALAKYTAENEAKSEAILMSSLKLQIILTAIVTIIYLAMAKPIALILNDPKLVSYIQLSTLIFPLYGIFELYIGYYNGLHKFKKQALLENIYSVSKLLFILLFAYLFYLYGVIIGFIIAPLLTIYVGFHLPKKIASIFPYKKLIFFSIPLILFAFLSVLLQSIDLYFIKSLGESENDPGFYTANQNITKIPFFAFNAFALVLFPSISRALAANQIKKIRSIIQISLRLILILLIPGTLFIAASSSQIIEILYSKIYLPGALSLSILIFASGFFTIFTVLANILNGAGMPKWSLLIAIVGVANTALLCFALVPVLGLVGGALSTTIGSFAAMSLAIYIVYQRFRVFISVKSIVKIIFASIVTAGLIYVIKIPIFLLPLLYLILFGIYFVLLIIMKEITNEDWREVKALMPDWMRFIK